MDILSIGNSFSQDAQRYLHGIARSAGFNINCYNLYIGGCPLSRHYRNMISGEREYTLEMNGVSTGFHVSLDEAVLNRDWSVITLQQASGKSPDFETYKPYIRALASHVSECVPSAKIVIHQTWGYEDGYHRLTEELGYRDHHAMFADVRAAYELAARDAVAHHIFPSGEVMANLTRHGIKVHRDGYHLSLGIGRYAAALTWFKMLTGADVSDVSFSDFDVPVSDEEITLAKSIVNKVCDEYREKVILPF